MERYQIHYGTVDIENTGGNVMMAAALCTVIKPDRRSKCFLVVSDDGFGVYRRNPLLLDDDAWETEIFYKSWDEAAVYSEDDDRFLGYDFDVWTEAATAMHGLVDFMDGLRGGMTLAS